MVKIQIDKGSCTIRASGSVDEIVAQLMVAIGDIYQSIKMTNGQEEAAKFRIGLMICMAPDSPAWNPSDGMVVIKK